MSKVALITGINGQDASYLAELLLENNYKVHGLLRADGIIDTSNIDNIMDKITIHYGDLADDINIRSIINKVKPDEIYNLGAIASVPLSFDIPRLTFEVNSLGVLSILEAIKGTDIKLFQASTCAMFGETHKILTEETPMKPIDIYGLSKLCAYHLIRMYRKRYGIKAWNGILYNNESVKRPDTFLTKKVIASAYNISQGKDDYMPVGNMETKRDWGYAPEYMYWIWKMLQDSEPDDFLIATNESHTVREVVEYVFKKFGLDYKKYAKKDKRFIRPFEADILQSDCSRAKKAFGFNPKYKIFKILDIMIDDYIKNCGGK